MIAIPAPLQQALQAPDKSYVVGGCEQAAQLRADSPASPETGTAELAVLVLGQSNGQADPPLADIAHARDIGARRCLAWVVDHAAWPDDELRALGFSPVAPQLWGYNIADYKPVPDWLNPRHWANPELWDKHRW